MTFLYYYYYGMLFGSILVKQVVVNRRDSRSACSILPADEELLAGGKQFF
jgi:hypothetical protein